MNQEEWVAPRPPGDHGASPDVLAGQPWVVPAPRPPSGPPLPAPSGTDGFSVAALVFGILALVPVAVPLGVIGLVRTRHGARRGRGLAIAGLVLSTVWVGALVVVLVGTGADGFLTYNYSTCVRDRCNVTMRGDQSEELSGHEVAVSRIGFGGTTFTVDGHTVTVREGETQQVGPSVVHLASVERDVSKFSIDFGGPFVERSELESGISTGLAVDVGQVSCPRDLFAEEGISMQCRLETSDAASHEVLVTVTKVENGQVDFDFETDYPAVADEGTSTAEELVWLQAVEQLLPKMNEIFDDIPIELTAAALQQVAERLRGCGRELARIGPASPRLQQVQDLLQQACREYDTGADCFAGAADIAISVGSAEIEEFDRLLDCGFAASELGSEPLADAIVKASELTGYYGQ